MFEFMFDSIVIGGSFAGHAAALQLGRARQRTLLVDGGLPRNRFAAASHGFLGQDGVSPAQILATARQQLMRYATVEVRDGEVVNAVAIERGFRVSLANGQEEMARTLILATGVRDLLPDIPGMQERWGTSVLHCPYCHGYEVNQQPLGVLANNALAFHQAMILPDWGATTFFTQGLFEPSAEQVVALASRGVQVERSQVVELFGEAPHLDGVRLADGRTIAISALFTSPQTVPVGTLAEKLGCAFEDGPTGPIISTDQRQQTSVPGVFAAGDVASPMPQVTVAAASGVVAGGSAHQWLIFRDA